MAAVISSLAAARRMCERSDWSLTNLHLQKMLYLAQMKLRILNALRCSIALTTNSQRGPLVS